MKNEDEIEAVRALLQSIEYSKELTALHLKKLMLFIFVAAFLLVLCFLSHPTNPISSMWLMFMAGGLLAAAFYEFSSYLGVPLLAKILNKEHLLKQLEEFGAAPLGAENLKLSKTAEFTAIVIASSFVAFFFVLKVMYPEKFNKAVSSTSGYEIQKRTSDCNRRRKQED